MEEIQLALGKVVEVTLRDDVGIFLDVELRHYTNADGAALMAQCRLGAASPDDWWVPDVGMEFLCWFPGLGPHGAIGGDLDEGIAFVLVGNRRRPPVKDGLAGSLSALRHLFRSRLGEALDRHVRGDLDQQVDGDEVRDTTGSLTRTSGALSSSVTGNETRTTSGILDWAITGVAKLVSQGVLRLFGSAVEIGADGGSFQKLVDERFIAFMNAHTHPGSNQPPSQTMLVGTHTTTDTKAS